jgi:hypothetical protein
MLSSSILIASISSFLVLSFFLRQSLFSFLLFSYSIVSNFCLSKGSFSFSNAISYTPPLVITGLSPPSAITFTQASTKPLRSNASTSSSDIPAVVSFAANRATDIFWILLRSSSDNRFIFQRLILPNNNSGKNTDTTANILIYIRNTRKQHKPLFCNNVIVFRLPKSEENS